MQGSFAGLTIVLQGLMAQQLAINTTAHNVANASTPGFSRQVVDLTAGAPFAAPSRLRPPGPGQFGTGVLVTTIRRVRDSLLDGRIWHSQQEQQRWQTIADQLRQVEVVFTEPADHSLSALFARFWNAWRTLADQPDDPAARLALREQAVALTSALQSARAEVVQARLNLDAQIGPLVDRINTLARQIADLNRQIVQVQASGQQPNDLQDQRDGLIEQLAGLVGVQVVAQPNGAVQVSVGGRPLVFGTAGERVDRLQTQPDPVNGNLLTIVWADGSPLLTPGGQVRGLLEARDSLLTEILTRLDSLAATLISQVNALHRTGFGLDNSTGRDFFTGTTAADIAVHPDILADERRIAAASGPNQPGDGTIARQIAALENALVMNGNTATMGQFYAALVTWLGSNSQQAQLNADTQEAIAQALTQLREQTSGVSLDEEAIALTRFQRTYEAAARVMTTLDELLDRVINGMGLVGR